MSDINQFTMMNIGLYLFAVLVTLSLLVGTAAYLTWKRPFMKLFIAMLLDNIITLLGETGLRLFDGNPNNIVILRISALCAFCGGTLLVALYSYCLLMFISEHTEKVYWFIGHINGVISAGYIIISVISVFNGMLFCIDENGCYRDGPLYWLVYVLDTLTMLIVVAIAVCHFKALTVRGATIMLTFSVFPLACVPLQLIWDATALSLATTLSLIILFILFHSDLTQRLAAAEVDIAEKERRLTEQRIATMISQIQPHFIYNTLGSIYQLCLEQPQQAAELTQNFSRYLRGNFSELDNNKPIQLSKELEHVKHYISIEQVRFPDISVTFDVSASDFLLPALSVQPLVENAIKHGLMGLESGGSVIISAYETEKEYCVSVKDDGVGFDVNAVTDVKKHIGIHNIRQRLDAICGGTLTIESAVGKGTTAVIIIPKEDKI